MATTQHQEKLLEIKGLKKYFPITRGFFKKVVGHVRAVDNVNFHIYPGETLGLVGESGCGKSTVARSILRAFPPSDGEILFHAENGEKIDIARLDKSGMQQMRRELKDRVAELLRVVGLRPEYMIRYPHAFSGGQRQRVGVARALALNPRFIAADEAVSALDVSVQAQTINLLQDLQEEFHLTYLFITHDLSVVKHISNRVAVMYVGKLVEMADTKELFHDPQHPYTEALLSAVPKPDPRFKKQRILLEGDVADPSNPPGGCYFHPRCRYAADICRTETPELREISPDHFVSCHLCDKLSLAGI